jgi:hypothetical protein
MLNTVRKVVLKKEDMSLNRDGMMNQEEDTMNREGIQRNENNIFNTNLRTMRYPGPPGSNGRIMTERMEHNFMESPHSIDPLLSFLGMGGPFVPHSSFNAQPTVYGQQQQQQSLNTDPIRRSQLPIGIMPPPPEHMPYVGRRATRRPSPLNIPVYQPGQPAFQNQNLRNEENNVQEPYFGLEHNGRMNSDEFECGICLESVDPSRGDPYFRTQCQHRFCLDCMNRENRMRHESSQDTRCPFCRRSIVRRSAIS